MRNRKKLATALAAAAVLALLGWILRDWVVARVYLQILETEGRIERLQIPRVLGVLAVQPGQRVADVGAGTGVFTRRLAEAVGNTGVVYAIDLNPHLLSHIEKTTDGFGLKNVQTVLAEPDDPLIPEPVDLILVCDTLHHIGDRKRYLHTLRRYLKPWGRVAVIDLWKSPHFSSSMKYSLRQLETWFEESDYKPAGKYDFLPDNFFVVYACEDCPD